MSVYHGRVVALSVGADHGLGRLGRVADALLAELDRKDAQPEIAMVYNILAEAPGQASYAVLGLEDEMWSLAPSLTDTFELLVHLANHAQRWDPTQVCRSSQHRPDGIVMTYRALMADTSTAAGGAIIANQMEGYYQHGDVAASTAAHGAFFATAADRADGSVRLVKLGLDGPVTDLSTALSAPNGAQVESGGVMDAGLIHLLSAMHDRWRRLAGP